MSARQLSYQDFDNVSKEQMTGLCNHHGNKGQINDTYRRTEPSFFSRLVALFCSSCSCSCSSANCLHTTRYKLNSRKARYRACLHRNFLSYGSGSVFICYGSIQDTKPSQFPILGKQSNVTCTKHFQMILHFFASFGNRLTYWTTKTNNKFALYIQVTYNLNTSKIVPK